MSRASIKASSLYSEAKMTDTTRVKFDVPIGTWGQTQIEVEYPWHRDLDSIILPLLEKAHEQQAERQRKHRAEAQPDRKSSRRTKNTTIAERTDRADRAEQQQQQTTLPMRPNEDIKLFLKGFESAGDFTTKRGDTIQRVLENYAQQAEKDVERLELFHKGKHVSRSMTPDTGSKTAPNCKSTSSLDNSGSTSTSTIQARRANRRRKKTSRNRQKSPENTTAPQEEEEEEQQQQQQDADNGNGDDDPPNSIERGSILVANDIITINTTSPGGRTHTHTNTTNNPEESSANRPKSLSPSLPPKSPLRRSSIHARTPSWASGQTSTTSDKALRLLGIDTNELAHQLAKIDSVMPLQRFTSGSVTQVELQPGPSRGVPVVQGPRKVSVVSDRAYGGEAEQLQMEGGGGRRPSMISSLEQEDEEEEGEGDCHRNQRQYYIDHSDVSSLHDSLHESLQDYSLSSHEHRRSTTTTTHEESSDRKTSTTTSNNKARKLLGVDRPDSYPGPTGRLGSTYTDYERRSQSYLTTGGGGGRVGGPPPPPPPHHPPPTTQPKPPPTHTPILSNHSHANVATPLRNAAAATQSTIGRDLAS